MNYQNNNRSDSQQFLSINPNYKGERVLGFFVNKKKLPTSISIGFGQWQRRFITINSNNMTIVYANAPLSKEKKVIDMKDIYDVKRELHESESYQTQKL